MRKLLLKVLLGMTFLLVGAVGMSKQVVADEGTPEEVTVVLTDQKMAALSGAWISSQNLSDLSIRVDTDTGIPNPNDCVWFYDMFGDTFMYQTLDEERKYLLMDGKVGVPFLREYLILDESNSVIGIGAKLITIEDHRVVRAPISEETMELPLKNGAVVKNQYGDVTLAFKETIFDSYYQVERVFYTVNGIDAGLEPIKIGETSSTTECLFKTPNGYRLIHLTFSKDTPATPPTLDIKEVTDKNFLSQVQMLFGDNSFKLFDISYLKDGVKGQPDGTVEVSLPIPVGFDKSKLAVYYVTDDGKTKEKITGKVLGDTYVFTTTHFSYYALVEEKTTISNTTQGQATETGGNLPTTDAGKTAVPVRHTGLGTTFPILSGLILLVGSAFVSYRKQTAR